MQVGRIWSYQYCPVVERPVFGQNCTPGPYLAMLGVLSAPPGGFVRAYLDSVAADTVLLLDCSCPKRSDVNLRYDVTRSELEQQGVRRGRARGNLAIKEAETLGQSLGRVWTEGRQQARFVEIRLRVGRFSTGEECSQGRRTI